VAHRKRRFHRHFSAFPRISLTDADRQKLDWGTGGPEFKSRRSDHSAPTADPALLRHTHIHEKDRLPVIRPLDAFAAVADAVGVRRAVAVDRLGRCGRRAWRGRGLFPCPSFRTAARLTVSAYCWLRS